MRLKRGRRSTTCIIHVRHLQLSHPNYSSHPTNYSNRPSFPSCRGIKLYRHETPSSSTFTATYPIEYRQTRRSPPQRRPLISSLHKPQTATWHASRRLTDTLVHVTAPLRRWIPYPLGGLARPTTRERRASGSVGWDDGSPPLRGWTNVNFDAGLRDRRAQCCLSRSGLVGWVLRLPGSSGLGHWC